MRMAGLFTCAVSPLASREGQAVPHRFRTSRHCALTRRRDAHPGLATVRAPLAPLAAIRSGVTTGSRSCPKRTKLVSASWVPLLAPCRASRDPSVQPAAPAANPKDKPLTKIVLKPGEPVEVALRRFRRAILQNGLIVELKSRTAYEKPTTERKRKKKAAESRLRKRLRSQMLPKKLY